MESSHEKRRFQPPWRFERSSDDYFVVKDAKGVQVAIVPFSDQLQQWGGKYLSSDEARRIAKAVARLPEFLMQRHGFYPRGGGHPGWKPSRPYHVALNFGVAGN